MPDPSPLDPPASFHAFAPRVLRADPAERLRLDALTERALARHPAWPWPLIEAEARRALDADPSPTAHGP